MITAAVTAAITFVLRLFDINLSAYQIAWVAGGVKLTIVAVGVIFGGKLLRKRAAMAEAARSPAVNAPVSEATPDEAPPSPPSAPKP